MPAFETYSRWSSQGLFYTDSWNDDTDTILPDDQEEREQPPKPVALLLHGLGSSSSFYHTIIPTISSSIRCIAFDYPGSGMSPPTPLSSPHSIETLAKTAIELIDELGFKEKIIVVGHSIGSIVASHLTAEYPDRIGGVVLLGAINPREGLAYMIKSRIDSITQSGEGLINLASSLPQMTTSRTSTPLQRAFIRSSVLSTDPNEYIRLSQVIIKSKQPLYSKIKAPLLILAGMDDMKVSSEEIFEAYGTDSHKKQLEWLKDCGHWTCVEQGDVVAERIKKFVEQDADVVS
ncbi:alpha beta protein [Rutstroemia sp. NJR-2017a WRK4]|nr:alpha beta protein [Rutstroemia sp. NJR-2017a WRK4]